MGEASYPVDWLSSVDGVVRLVAGQTVRLQPGLTWTATGEPVAWNPEGASVSVEALSGAAATATWVADGGAANWTGGIEVSVEAGAESRITLITGDSSERPLGTVIGVAEMDIVSMELVVLQYLEEFGEAGLFPTGARAILRTANGDPVLGAPVSWSVTEGVLALTDFAYRPGLDYLMASDDCELPSEHLGDHSATLQASLGSLSASVTYEWTYAPAELPDESEWEPSPDCEGPATGDDDDATADDDDATADDDDDAADDDDSADDDPRASDCQCSSASLQPATPLFALGLVGLLGLRRRRTRSD